MADMSTFAGGAGGLFSVGASIYGGIEGSEAANKKYQSELAIAQNEQLANQQRRLAMELNARRSQRQVVRTAQQASANALSAATNQGAQFGSGLQGGLAGVSAQSATAQEGIYQNLQIGEKLFDYDQNINAAKLQAAQAETQMSEAQGFMNIGKSVGGSFKDIMSLASLLPMA
jgi:hypothetical protein